MKIQLKIEKLVYNGYGIGKSDGLVIFVPFAVPEDVLLVEIVERKKDYAFGVIRDILQPSPYRVEPPCENFTRCGGCQWLNVDYERQLQEKRAILEREFTRHTLNLPEIKIIKGKPFNWRRRARLFVERRTIGFKSFRGSTVVPVGRCVQLTETLNNALLNLYTHPSVLKHAEEVWLGEDKDQSQLLVYIKAPKKIREIHQIFHRLKEKVGRKIGLRIAYKHKFSTLGIDIMEEDILNKKLFYTFHSFFQANRYLVEKLVETVVKEVKEVGKKNILELYSGVGTFTLPLSHVAERLTAIESSATSVKMLQKAIEVNRSHNIQILEMPVERALEGLNLQDFQILVTDPPRRGMKKEVVERLKMGHFERIIYISCNPVTMARDIKRFNAKVEKLYLIDQFPHTFHIETVAVLTI